MVVERSRINLQLFSYTLAIFRNCEMKITFTDSSSPSMLTNTVEVVMVLLAHPAILAWVLVAEPWPCFVMVSEITIPQKLKLECMLE